MEPIGKVIEALENCTQVPQCRDCQWDSCSEFGHERVEMPMDLAQAALEWLKKIMEGVTQ